MWTKLVLTTQDARHIMNAARVEATRRRLEVSIAVVDDAGILILLERLEGARLHTPDAATLKARTAAIARTTTATLQGQVSTNPALLSFPGRMPLSGGVPLVFQEHIVGGVGSSGAQPDEDEAVCQAALVALRELPING
ncbi:GlcG/HbpS family heme-binding protein [Methylobacterium planeticum]|uniref:Heme-binding protein n=1 Tax=Methylobacterium planeticum TaxID=2615211 RepID=A0A6N6MMT4_9HYPH|nr:heme-binding protein [Methylobacterium planeticum]KAB1071670.1 hypothetical protein F6X51_19125 [Methylobacterium planeticum]